MALATSIVVLGALLVAPLPAVAAPVLPDPEPGAVTAIASLEKTASVETVAPGETFTYTLTVGCSSITDTGCRNAVLTDVVPAPFEVVDAVVGGGVNTAAEPVIAGTTVGVTWTTPLGDGTIGILDATTGVVEITAILPADTSYDVTGVPVVNDAVIEGTNFTDVDAQVAVTPLVPLALATTPAKTLTPDTAVAIAGTAVTAQLSGANTSNATVESLTIQDPAGPADPVPSPNPFEYLGFTGFGAVTAPEGADPALTEYSVFYDGVWIAAPGGVVPGILDLTAIRGTRVVFSGAIPAGASGAVQLELALTPLAEAQADGFVVANTVSSAVTLGDDTAQAQTSADFTLLQNDIQVAASKAFDPALVVAGESSEATLIARNASTIALETLTLREPSTGTFPDAYAFAGFSEQIVYPAAATSGTVVYHTAFGDQSVPFASGQIPAPPTGPFAVEWFEVVFQGPIQPGGETAVTFEVATDPDLGDTVALPTGVPNEVSVTGTNQGAEDSATATDTLYIYDEVIETYVGKTLRPTQIVAAPGEVVTVSLQGGLTERPNPPATPNGSTGNAQQIVIQDPLDPVEPDDWWNAFDVTAITQTPVPAGATLTVEYYDTTDDTWKTLTTGIVGPTIYSAPVPSGVQDVAGGIRFVYDYTSADGLGFPPGTDLAPNFTSEVRDEGRYTGEPPFSEDASTFIPNCAQSGATSGTPGVAPGSAAMNPADCPRIELIPVDPGDADLIDKAFGTSSSGGVKSVIARSGDTIPSTLRWSTGGFSNLERVEITDTADPGATPLAQSMYDEFDLTRIQPITPATDPLIAFDQVTAVQLWIGGAWVAAANSPCPSGCIGQFPGMNLTTAERQSATGVRLIFAESPNRAAASAGNLDAPAVGSGVARSFGNVRPIALTWQVRDERRSNGVPILGDVVYNLPDAGIVRNTAAAVGYPADGGTPLTAQDQDDVVIIDVPITTTTDKNWLDGPISIPIANSGIDPTAYPISRVVITTRNTTPARVDQLWITDPAPGSDSTVFDTQQFGGFIRIDNPAGADPAQTFIDLYFEDGSTVTYDRATALALTEATVPPGRGRIVGFQARFEGRIAAGAAAVIEMRLRLKPINSATGEPVTVADSPAVNTAEGVAADIDAPGACPPPGGPGTPPRYACDQGSATLVLAEPSFDVTVSKSFSPAEQKEPDRSPIIMNLRTQPSGTTRTVTILIGDSDPRFWNAFDLVGIDPSFSLTSPIARVQACYVPAGTFTVEGDSVVVTGDQPNICSSSGGTLDEAAALINDAPPDVQQITFQFWSENGLGWTNPANPVQNVPVLVQRRTELRTGGPVPSTRSDQVAAPGQPAAGVFDNVAGAIGVSAEIASGVPLISQAATEAQYRFLHRQNTVSVTKTPNGDVRPGVPIPYTLSFANTGERPITDPVFTDELPMDADGAQLIFYPDRDPSVSPYSFTLTGPTPTAGLPLPTDPDALTIDEQPDRIVFTPPPGTVLGVGQTYRITIQLMLRPGLTPDDDIENTAVIAGGEPFDDCVTTPAGQVTSTCADSSVVSPLAIPALSTIKYVKADAPHSIDGVPDVLSVANGYTCEGTATTEGFYRAPCVPVTLPGGTETWRFTVTNAGTLPLDRVVSIDNLPIPGDQGLIATVPRESQWPPTLVGGVELLDTPTTPPGAVLTTYYSTSSVPCIADLNPLGTPCAPGAWLPLAGADPADVRSLKYVVEFPGGDLLQPGESLNLQFQTRTTPTALASTDFPIAYNTVSTGGSAVGAQPTVVPATEGRRVGVTYPTGAIALAKEVDGPAADLAPDTFPVQLVCTIGGTPITGLPLVTLTPGADPIEVDGLPIGAECTATEGRYGQTTTTIGTATVGGPEDEIGVITVENYYDVSDLTIVKTVDADGRDAQGRPIAYGPFTFSVVCAFEGEPVWADGYDADTPMTATISTDERWALAGLPVGSECTVTEDEDLGAESTSMTVSVDGVAEPAVPGTSVDVTIVDGATVEVEAINAFAAGSLLIRKVVEGPAADAFGAGPFRLLVDCTLDTGSGTARVWAGFVTLGGDEALTATVDDIALGAECTVQEIMNGGATSTTVTPSTVTIGDGAPVEVTVTNVFEAGSLTVTKQIIGEGAELWGGGPFEVTLECTRTFGDPVEIPGGATRILSAANAYTATYDPLLQGLLCTLTETDTGGATSTVITDADGAEVGIIDIPQGNVAVTVTNTFDLGSVEVVKTVSGGAGAAHTADGFEVAASCLWNGEPIEPPGGGILPLSTTEPAVFADLPVGAECTVTETDSGGADAVTYSPEGAGDGGSATVVVGADTAASVTIDNRFDPELAGTGSSPPLAAGLTAGLLLLMGTVFLVTARRRRRS